MSKLFEKFPELKQKLDQISMDANILTPLEIKEDGTIVLDPNNPQHRAFMEDENDEYLTDLTFVNAMKDRQVVDFNYSTQNKHSGDWNHMAEIAQAQLEGKGYSVKDVHNHLNQVRSSNEDEIVQYFVVNSELNMSTGKIAAQVAHVTTLITKDFLLNEQQILNQEDIQLFYKWLINNQTKIILKAKEKDLLKLIEQGFYYIRDLGKTEIPEGSLTVVGLPPMRKSEAKQYVKRLRLY